MNTPARALERSQRPSLLARLQPRQALMIEGLPPALAALGAGQTNVVYADPSPARDALFWQTAAAALRGAATVLSTRSADDIAAALRKHGLDIDAPGAVGAKANLCALHALPNRDGAEVLVEALDALAAQCAEPGSQFLIEGAELFFDWNDRRALSRQGALIANWTAQHRYGVLLVLAPPLPDAAPDAAETAPAALAESALTQGASALPADAPPAAAEAASLNRPAPDHAAVDTLEEFHARFAGAAQLLQVGGQYTWEVAFWRDRDTLLASTSLPLRFSPVDYRLMVASDTFEKNIEEAGLLAPDETRVIVARSAVLRERSLPEYWDIVDDNDAAVAAGSHAVAATVLLSYSSTAQFDELAEQVYTLRRSAGQALKIVVREDGVTMRYALVMRNLGVNLVIPRDTPIARVEAMLDGVQGQLFSRPLPADYKVALSALLHSEEMGYVNAPKFVELVRSAIERSRALQLPNVLLRLPLLPEVAHVDALKACYMRRAGDLSTACGDSLYAFFFACRLADVSAVYQRVFRLPLADLFRGELRGGDYNSITSMLDTLEQDIAAEPPPDYTNWLQQNQKPLKRAAADAPEAAPVEPADDDAPAVLPRLGTPGVPLALATRPGGPVTPRAAPTPVALPFKALG